MTTTTLGPFNLDPAPTLEPQPSVVATIERFEPGAVKFLVSGDANRIEIGVETVTSVLAFVTDRGLPTEKRTPLPNDDPRTAPMIAWIPFGNGSTIFGQLPARATTLFAPTWGSEGTTKTTTREVPLLGALKATELVYSPRAPIGDLEVLVTARILVRGTPPASDESGTTASVDMVQ